MPENLVSAIALVMTGTGCRGGLSVGKVGMNLMESWTIISGIIGDLNKL